MSTEPDQLPSPQQIDAVLEFAPALARLQEADGNETIALSMDALYDNGFVIDCDWPAYQDEAERFYLEPERLASADLSTLQKLFTLHARKDRFDEGHFAWFATSAHARQLLARLGDIGNA